MSAQQTLIGKYGLPTPEYLSKWVMMWEVKKDFPWFPAVHFEVNKDFKNLLHNAFTKLQAAGIQGEIKSFDGCLNNRTVRGMASKSLHAWAAAIDLNASIEALGQIQTNWSQQFLVIIKGAGIFWGGDFHNRKDPMHFALLDG